ncbi:MAG: hypothetical protein AAGD35_23045 [Actinomycetota bacterium]
MPLSSDEKDRLRRFVRTYHDFVAGSASSGPGQNQQSVLVKAFGRKAPTLLLADLADFLLEADRLPAPMAAAGMDVGPVAPVLRRATEFAPRFNSTGDASELRPFFTEQGDYVLTAIVSVLGMAEAYPADSEGARLDELKREVEALLDGLSLAPLDDPGMHGFVERALTDLLEGIDLRRPDRMMDAAVRLTAVEKVDKSAGERIRSALVSALLACQLVTATNDAAQIGVGFVEYVQRELGPGPDGQGPTDVCDAPSVAPLPELEIDIGDDEIVDGEIVETE